MDLRLGAVEAHAIDVRLQGLLDVAEIRASAVDATASVEAGGVAIGAELSISLTVVEAAVNRLLARAQHRPLAALEVALLDGSVRMTGKYSVAGPVALPFELTGRLEIEGGARLRLQTDRVSVIGASLPEMATGPVGERVNAQLAQVFDVTRFPVPLRLTRVVVEPGRVTLHAVWRVDAHLGRPAPAAIEAG